jgi:hypothetical protein
VYVNLENAVSVYWSERDKGTIIAFVGGEKDAVTVQEKPEQISRTVERFAPCPATLASLLGCSNNQRASAKRKRIIILPASDVGLGQYPWSRFVLGTVAGGGRRYLPLVGMGHWAPGIPFGSIMMGPSGNSL